MKAKKIVRNMYFVKYGDRTGQFLIFVDFNKETKVFSALGLPESEAVYISQNDVEEAISHKVLEHIETLPKDVFKECKNEFKYRIKDK